MGASLGKESQEGSGFPILPLVCLKLKEVRFPDHSFTNALVGQGRAAVGRAGGVPDSGRDGLEHIPLLLFLSDPGSLLDLGQIESPGSHSLATHVCGLLVSDGEIVDGDCIG